MGNIENFDWKKFIFEDSKDNENMFDERILYREMKRNKLIQKCNNLNKKYLLKLKYDNSISEIHYVAIMKKYFAIKDENINNVIDSLKHKQEVILNNLSSSASDLLVYEINNYLNKNKITINLVTKEVNEDAIKKSGNNIT